MINISIELELSTLDSYLPLLIRFNDMLSWYTQR